MSTGDVDVTRVLVRVCNISHLRDASCFLCRYRLTFKAVEKTMDSIVTGEMPAWCTFSEGRSAHELQQSEMEALHSALVKAMASKYGPESAVRVRKPASSRPMYRRCVTELGDRRIYCIEHHGALMSSLSHFERHNLVSHQQGHNTWRIAPFSVHELS